MKTTHLLASLTATASMMIAGCGSSKAAEKTDAPADTTAKPAEAHCGAEKGAHEGSCGGAPAADAPAPGGG